MVSGVSWRLPDRLERLLAKADPSSLSEKQLEAANASLKCVLEPDIKWSRGQVKYRNYTAESEHWSGSSYAAENRSTKAVFSDGWWWYSFHHCHCVWVFFITTPYYAENYASIMYTSLDCNNLATYIADCLSPPAFPMQLQDQLITCQVWLYSSIKTVWTVKIDLVFFLYSSYNHNCILSAQVEASERMCGMGGKIYAATIPTIHLL